MQEYALFGVVSSESHFQVLQQCVGVARMQPQPVEELHLIFKAKPPPGLAEIQKSSGGGSQGVVPPEVQKTRAMLNASLYYIQLVGTAQANSLFRGKDPANGHLDTTKDVVMSNGDVQESNRETKKLKWSIEFRDTPDPGKQPVNSRLLYKTPVLEGDMVQFIQDFGFEYISRYVVIGHKVYDEDTTLFLHKVMQCAESAEKANIDVVAMPKTENLVPLDKSDGFILSATIETVDGGNADLRERATRQLLSMKETVKHAVTLAPGDRLALDTKIPIGSHR